MPDGEKPVNAKAGQAVQPLVSSCEEELGFADFEHLGAASRADALGCRAKIFHGDSLGTLHVPLGATLDTITLDGSHMTPPFRFVS